jgi:hypothetical protein
MPDPTPPRRPRLLVPAVVGAVAAAGVAAWAVRHTTAGDGPKPLPAGVVDPASYSTTVGAMPLFATWPKDQAPEVVLVLTGQTKGYTAPCGCSRPQKGGLGPAKKVREQDLLKYRTIMTALRTMGYAAVGLGEYEFEQQLIDLLAQYTLQNPDAPPAVLAANLVGLTDDGKPIPREQQFPGAGKRPMVEAVEVIGKDPKGGDHLPVGVTAVLGAKLFEDKIKKIDPHFGFLDNRAVLKDSLDAIKARTKGAGVNVLLYAGGKEEALRVAQAFPDYHVVLCQSDDPEPPQFPALANGGRTFVVQVGYKGQNLGVVGVFKTPAGYELKYQLVPMTEEFVTPPDGKSEILDLLDKYRTEVKDQNLLAKFTDKPLPHPAQVQNPAANLSYVGSDRCQACHAGEFRVWQESKHSHAMEALENPPEHAKRPKFANFDGECVQCHTVGFGYQTGYTSEDETKHLRHVGCESCHGPGSGHAANPFDPKLKAALSPWKSKPEDRLPAKADLLKLGATKPGDPLPVRLEARQQQTLTAVRAACMKCHDEENDPKFEVEKYMPQIWHSK